MKLFIVAFCVLLAVTNGFQPLLATKKAPIAPVMKKSPGKKVAPPTVFDPRAPTGAAAGKKMLVAKKRETAPPKKTVTKKPPLAKKVVVATAAAKKVVAPTFPAKKVVAPTFPAKKVVAPTAAAKKVVAPTAAAKKSSTRSVNKKRVAIVKKELPVAPEKRQPVKFFYDKL
jgi:hypothetical protein